MFFTVVMPDGIFIFDFGLDVDRAAPEFENIFKHFACILLIEFRSFVTVAKKDFAVAVIITVGDLDVWITEIIHITDQLIADTLPLLFGDRPLFLIDQLVNKEIELIAQSFGQVIPEE